MVWGVYGLGWTNPALFPLCEQKDRQNWTSPSLVLIGNKSLSFKCLTVNNNLSVAQIFRGEAPSKWSAMKLTKILTDVGNSVGKRSWQVSKYISIPFTVYYKRQEDPPGSCSPCGESLVTFMRSVCRTLDVQHSKDFLHRFLEGVTVEMWSGAALVHLVRALSHMPRAPLIGGTTLAFLRRIIINTMSTMQVLFLLSLKWKFSFKVDSYFNYQWHSRVSTDGRNCVRPKGVCTLFDSCSACDSDRMCFSNVQ